MDKALKFFFIIYINFLFNSLRILIKAYPVSPGFFDMVFYPNNKVLIFAIVIVIWPTSISKR